MHWVNKKPTKLTVLFFDIESVDVKEITFKKDNNLFIL